MPRTLHLDAFGTVVQVTLADQDAASVQRAWGHCLTAAPAAGRPAARRVLTDHDAADDPGQDDRHDLGYRLATEVTLAGIEGASGRRLMLHAAGVADGGRVAVLVAASGTGKTTAAARLGTAGLGYLSDETVALDEQQRALPYPKPLSLVIDPQRPHRKSQHGPQELGLTVVAEPTPARLVVLLERDAGRTEPPELVPVPPLTAMLELIPHTSALPSLPNPLGRLAGLVRAAGGVSRLRYREIVDAAPLLRDELAAERPGPALEVLDPPVELLAGPDHRSEASAVPPATVTAHRWRRGPFTQAIRADEQTLLLVGAVPVLLAGPGHLVWQRAEEPADADDLVSACLDAYGDPGDGTQRVHAVIAELAGHGLLQPA